MRPTLCEALGLSALIRVGLILYSEYHDSRSSVKYTDVDYRVFTDAARYLLTPGKNGAQGMLGTHIGNPYLRDTYRYTPVLALLMTPNELLHPSFGKVLFALCDLLVGAMLHRIFCAFPPTGSTSTVEIQQQATVWVSVLWLFNPLVFSISTRGSSESVLGALVVGTLYSAMKDSPCLTALLLGLSVHWKIYPIIYGPSIVTCIGAASYRGKLKGRIAELASTQGILFAVLSAGTFSVVTGVLYLIWGYPLLWNSYLYHIGRLDHRHNFSPYFYATYLSYPSAAQLGPGPNPSLISHPLLSFVPQVSLSLGAGILLSRRTEDLPFAWFVQTMIFVTFNKVCTSQYFLWYMWFLPLVLPRLRLTVRDALVMTGAWVGSQALWLYKAYKLEFLGEQVFLSLWSASMLFLIVNCWVLVKIISAYAR